MQNKVAWDKVRKILAGKSGAIAFSNIRLTISALPVTNQFTKK